MQIHLLLLDTSTIVPDIEQHSFEECYSSDPKVAINLLTELDILCTNADHYKMDDLSTLTYIAGNESDLILISGVLSKRCVDSLSTAGLALRGYQSFYNFDSDQIPQNMRSIGIYISNKL